MQRLFRIPLLVSLVLLTEAAVAQENRARYEAARSIGERFAGKVFRDRVEPRWIEDGARFWYRVRVGPQAHRFILVDPATGTRGDAFDHAQVAEALGNGATADRLPFSTIDFPEPGIVEFETGAKRYRHDPSTGNLSEIEPVASANGSTVKLLDAPRTATFNGDSTEITIENRTEAAIDLFWVNSVDDPRAYGSIAPGKSRTQHTFAGHVWLTRPTRSRKPNAVFEATPDGLAVVDGSWQPAAPPPKNDPTRSLSPDGSLLARMAPKSLILTRVDAREQVMEASERSRELVFRPPIVWSPDSRYFLAQKTTAPTKRKVHFVESAPEEQLQPRLHSIDYVKPGDPIPHPRPVLFEIASGREVEIDGSLFPTPWNLRDFAWSPDSSAVSFLYNQRGHQIQRVISIDAATGTAKALIEEAPETFVCYSSKTFLRRLPDTHEILWMSERDGWNHLYLFDASTGELKNQVTEGDWVVRSVEYVDPETRQVWFFAGGVNSDEDPYHLHLCRANFDGTGFIQLTAGDGTHEVTFSPDRRFFIDRYSRVDFPPVTELRRSDDGSLICALETADITALSDAGWRAPERFVAPGRDGETPIYGIIRRPTDFDPAKRYPVVEQIYAGPHSAHVPKAFAARGHAIAELGFIVVQIDGMGTSHRSKSFHDVAWQNLGDAGFPDRIAWIQAAAKTRPEMDLTRVGIYGGSAGGQNAMRALIAHHDFYHVAVADCGCHDNRMDKIWWNEQWMGWPIPEGGGHWSESSNVDQAHRLKGDLLLIVGELDRNVDPASTMQASAALQRAKIAHDLLVVPGVGHGAAGSPYARERQWDFLVKKLQVPKASP